MEAPRSRFEVLRIALTALAISVAIFAVIFATLALIRYGAEIARRPTTNAPLPAGILRLRVS
jgi:hypothetical protein